MVLDGGLFFGMLGRGVHQLKENVPGLLIARGAMKPLVLCPFA